MTEREPDWDAMMEMRAEGPGGHQGERLGTGPGLPWVESIRGHPRGTP